jgi:hypothetical protein
MSGFAFVFDRKTGGVSARTYLKNLQLLAPKFLSLR